MAAADSGTYTPESMRLRRRLAEAMLTEGLDTSPIGHWTQGAARMLKAALGGYGAYKIGQEEKEFDRQTAELLAGALGIGDDDGGTAGLEPVSSLPDTPAGDKSLPRSLRTNNPGAIEFGPFAKSAGATGSDGRFATFPDMDTGYQAMNRLLDVYADKHGLITPRGIISRWAPAGVDNNATDAYVANVSRALGIGPDDPVPPEMRRQLVEAMARFEAGTDVPPAPGGAPVQMAQAGMPPLPVQSADVMQAGTPLVPGVTSPGTTQPPPEPSRLGGFAGLPPTAAAPAAPQPQPAPAPEPAARQPFDPLAPLEPPSTLPGPDELRAMLANPRTRGMAVQMILDQRKRRAELGKPTDELREYRIDMLQRQSRGETDLPTFGEWKAQMRKAGASSTNVTVGGEKAFATELGKGVAKDFMTRREAAASAATGLQANQTARELLDSGMITGFGANYILEFGKALQQMGIGFARDPIANTEAFVASRAREVGNIIKLFGAGTGLSDADRAYAEKAAAGQIDMTEQAIRKVLEINDRAARNVIAAFNKDAEKIDPDLAPFPLTVPMPAAPEPRTRQPVRRRYNPATGAIE